MPSRVSAITTHEYSLPGVTLATCDVFGPCAGHGVDLLMHPSRGERLGQAALLFDLLKKRPGLVGHLLRQSIDKPAATGRVHDAMQL